MTKQDKLLLTHFVTKTAMYIHPVDIHNILSFIQGYEIGRKRKCHFYELAKDLLSKKYKINYPNTGLLGQLKELSKRLSITDIITFKKIALEVIALGELDVEVGKVLRARIVDMISMIKKAGHPVYNERWKDYWLSFVAIKSPWFKQLWNKKELAIIRSMDREVLSGNLFNFHQYQIPSDAMLELRNRFNA